MKAHEFWLGLEYERVLQEVGTRPEPLHPSSVKQALRHMREEVHDSGFLQKVGDMMQKMGEFGHFAHLQALVQSIEPALFERLGSAVFPTLVREFPSGDFNGCVVATLAGYLVLISSGSAYFVNQFTKVAAYACPQFIQFPGANDCAPEQGPDGQPMEGGPLLTFCALATAVQTRSYLEDGNPSALSMLPPVGGAKQSAVMDIVLAAERFMIAHEYAHIALGHLAPLENTKGIEFQAVRNREHELAADQFGAELLLHESVAHMDMLGQRKPEPVNFAIYRARVLTGIAIFFCADAMIQEFSSAHQNEARVDHPSAPERWRAARASLIASQKLSPDDISSADVTFSFFQRMTPVARAIAESLLQAGAEQADQS